jgi:uncharacterized protein (TIGR04255 family)
VPEFPQFTLAVFDNPPVVETVLSLQFEELSAMQVAHLGLFWRKVKDRFPKTEARPALAPIIERSPEPVLRGRIKFEVAETLELPRLLLLNSAGSEMIQVQRDRFIKNWRKAGPEDQYPHYEPVIKPAFARDLKEFESFLAEEQLGTVKVNQCEVTYVNHIVSGEGWQQPSDIDQIFTFWTHASTPAPGRAEDFGIHMRFPIRDNNEQPIGRLYVDVQPALRASDNLQMYVMNLTARGQYGPGLEFFDIGRKWIVKSFEQLTTEHMHRIWRKR